MYIHNSEVFFQWDSDKNLRNFNKHGVAFDEAATIWFDENLHSFPDTKHSTDEDRLIAIGKSSNERHLYVAHTIRRTVHEEKEIRYCRIISARIASSREKRYSVSGSQRI
ncbi:BrnT family toxin [Bdellovibrio sp. HCB290]|uniref:BrnT family toxin n=1 Tax=Bdellovibrio sp. HCB290 TaxID=3394356 RepID=UPI0039B5B35E